MFSSRYGVATHCDAHLLEHRDSVFSQVVAAYTFDGLFLTSPAPRPPRSRHPSVGT